MSNNGLSLPYILNDFCLIFLGYCMCSAIGVNQYILNDGKVIGNMNEKCKYSADLTKHKDNSNEDCFFEVIVHNTFKKRFGLFSAVDSVEIQVNHLRVNLYQGSIAKVGQINF